MKRQLRYFAVVSVLLMMFASSCSDNFLTETVEDQYSTDITDRESLRAGLILMYEATSNFYSKADQQGWPALWNVGTDVAWPIQAQGVEIPFYRYDNLTSDNYAASWMWNWEYDIIENANNVINNIENNGMAIEGMTEQLLAEYNAEARFFRAKAYEELATLFGGVPIVTEPITEPKFDFVRADLAEVNALIEEDLLFAVENLPDLGQTEHEQRVSNAAASQLLAKSYLRTGKYEEAEAQADRVINNPNISLVDTRYGVKVDQPGDPFSDMFWKGNMRRSQGNTEAIWVLEMENPSDVRGGSTGAPQQRRVWQGSYHSRNGLIPAEDLGGRGIARLRLNNWVLYDLYDDDDMRNSEHNILRRHTYNDPNHELFGEPVPYEGPDTLFILTPYTMKWKHFDPRDTFGWGMWKDFILMRLGETYLLKAEAQLMQNNPGGAAATINILRDRANAPTVSAGDIDLDFILDERARELLAEENRRMELMRTKTLVDRVHLNYGAPEGSRVEGIRDENLLFPIPVSEIRLNRDGDMPQNPGYSN
ncbi:RagB/SusD family nutrient uptake outer membrane protein [Rhodohalobacter sp. SW132]|uniref:RagB/SusD family nutrient uptake outer membrane protein n=1 Tax=Rhodohalobacter sp. SW132 TaxID=2293433 RepID=UPI000E266BDB|nr:RagB/SusD family nutrient uptake outer membrane protein [Rhodohalobacter sp. SW132]REL24775.1 RagB/SusD family nutrient uptake outer membrane protein [Rhodohalobacter sp. SW132]